MSHRDDILDAMTGRLPCRIPAILRLDPWYNFHQSNDSLPDEIKNFSLNEVQDYLGFALSARDAKVFVTKYTDVVEVTKTRCDDHIITEWRIPTGSLHRVEKITPTDKSAGLRPFTVEYPVKTSDDYRLYAELIENIHFTPCYNDFENYDRQIGESGLPMVILGANPFHDLLMNWVGYEKGFLDLYDYPEAVDQAVEIANTAYQRMWSIVANSPARLVMHGVNFDIATTPPPLFRKYFLPYLRAFNQCMHQAGKITVFHADGDMTDLLDLAVEAGYDVADCFACHPLVRCTFAQARAAWRNRICIWGGVPSNLLDSDTPLDRLHDHLDRLYRAAAPGDRFILGISDQVLPSAAWPHIKTIADAVRRYATYPIS
jgi:hypothetical protein